MLNLNIFNNLINHAKESSFVQNFINELSNFMSNNTRINGNNKSTKYSDYWKYQKFIEDNISSTIGLSRWANDIIYHEELSKTVNDGILKLSEKEGTLYRKKFRAKGSPNGNVYNIDKFENGKIEQVKIPAEKIPNQFRDEDIIFQYKEDDEIRIREDLRNEVVNYASEKCAELKLKEDEKVKEFKIEGHVYKAFEDDGYIFLKDLTQEKGYLLEDIDFVVDYYKGEGKYKIINGEYKKI